MRECQDGARSVEGPEPASLPGKSVTASRCPAAAGGALSGTWGGGGSASATLCGGKLPSPRLPLPTHLLFPWHLYYIRDVASLVA